MGRMNNNVLDLTMFRVRLADHVVHRSVDRDVSLETISNDVE